MKMTMLDSEKSEQLSKYINDISISGKTSLDETIMKKIKKICKISDCYVDRAYELLREQLTKEHSEIRFSSLLMIDQLFMRSHRMRNLLLAEFQLFTDLTLACRFGLALPPPKIRADLLKSQAVIILKRWHDQFGKDYKKLGLGYSYLKNCRKINFDDSNFHGEIAQRISEEQQQRIRNVKNSHIDRVLLEVSDLETEVDSIIVQAKNCMKLLVPDLYFEEEIESMPINPTNLPPSISSLNQGEVCVENASVQHSDSSYKTDNSSLHQLTNDLTVDESLVVAKNDGQVLSGCVLVEKEADESLMENTLEATIDSEENVSLPGPSSPLNVSSSPLNMSNSPLNVSNENILLSSSSLRSHGITKRCGISFELSDILQITETADNSDIITNFEDLMKETSMKLLPKLQSKLFVLTKCGAEEQHLKRVLDAKSKLEMLARKASKIDFSRSTSPKILGQKYQDEDSSDDESFITVKEKQGFEAVAKLRNCRSENSFKNSSSIIESKNWMPAGPSTMEDDPTSWRFNVKRLEKERTRDSANDDVIQPSTSKESNISCICAPVIPFGTDLLHWGQKVETPLVVRYDAEHRFWTSKDDSEVIDVNALESTRTRVINFTGKFEPVKWKCRFPLPSGKLCERMDRRKCPFHGEIVARDEMGQTANSDEESSVAVQSNNRDIAWNDPAYLADLEAQTGKKFTLVKPVKRHKDGLTNISIKRNSCRSRLESKVLSRAALKRVSSAMDELQSKRMKDKFGNQFNYAYPPR